MVLHHQGPNLRAICGPRHVPIPRTWNGNVPWTAYGTQVRSLMMKNHDLGRDYGRNLPRAIWMNGISIRGQMTIAASTRRKNSKDVHRTIPARSKTPVISGI